MYALRQFENCEASLQIISDLGLGMEGYRTEFPKDIFETSEQKKEDPSETKARFTALQAFESIVKGD